MFQLYIDPLCVLYRTIYNRLWARSVHKTVCCYHTLLLPCRCRLAVAVSLSLYSYVAIQPHTAAALPLLSHCRCLTVIIQSCCHTVTRCCCLAAAVSLSLSRCHYTATLLYSHTLLLPCHCCLTVAISLLLYSHIAIQLHTAAPLL